MLCLVAQLCPTLCSPPGSSVHRGFSRQEYFSGLPCPPAGDLPNPRIRPRSPTLQADSLPAEPPEKPKNAGVGRLSLLLWIFPTQELNLGLLPCRRILYQLSYEGSPLRPLGSSLWPERSFHALFTVTNLFSSKVLSFFPALLVFFPSPFLT